MVIVLMETNVLVVPLSIHMVIVYLAIASLIVNLVDQTPLIVINVIII